MVNDEIDTDYKCKNKVSVFSLSLAKVKEVKSRKSDLSKTQLAVEREVLMKKNEIALDYIFHNNNY
jgi:hypothetical protein